MRNTVLRASLFTGVTIAALGAAPAVTALTPAAAPAVTSVTAAPAGCTKMLYDKCQATPASLAMLYDGPRSKMLYD